MKEELKDEFGWDTTGTIWVEKDGLAYAIDDSPVLLVNEGNANLVGNWDDATFEIVTESDNTLLYILLTWLAVSFITTGYVVRRVIL